MIPSFLLYIVRRVMGLCPVCGKNIVEVYGQETQCSDSKCWYDGLDKFSDNLRRMER